jgi:hypothetical protein
MTKASSDLRQSITPWNTGLLEKLVVPKLVNVSPSSYRRESLTAVCTTASHWSTVWQIQPHLLPFSFWFSWISLSRLHVLSSGLFPEGFTSKTLCTHLTAPICATCSAHLIHCDLIILIIFCDECKLWSSKLCKFIQYSVTVSLLGPNIPLGIMFPNTLSMFKP